MTFESDLKEGNFTVPRCPGCRVIVWPPSDFCSRCLQGTVWEKAPSEGVVLEYSGQGGQHFCMAEMGGGSFRIVCRVVSGTPGVGKRVRVEKCGIRGGLHFFDVRVLD